MSETHLPSLLLTLKVTVESLLERQVADAWNIYGGLNRLCAALTDILYHGFKLCDSKGEPDLWTFIQGLNWLQPSLCGCVSPGQEAIHLPEAVKGSKAMQWVYYHVENHSIAEKLSWLLSDREHLLNCYHEIAFMCHQKYAEALLVCLKAVEQNQLSLMADVDPSLYVTPSKTSGSCKMHRRCASFPLAQVARLKPQDIEMPVFAGRESAVDRARVVTGLGVIHGSIPLQSGWHQADSTNLRRCRSLPTVLVVANEEPKRMRSKTIVSKISPSVLKVEYADSSRTQRISKCRKKRERTQRTFMEDGGTSVRQSATGYFPRPTQGQSLASFLSSGPFTSADLDRENAHFRISEAMISAIEQVKCNRTLRLTETGSEDGSVCGRASVKGSNSNDAAERQRLRRRRTRAVNVISVERPCGSWGDRDTTTSEQTPSPPSSSVDESSEDTAGSDAEQLALSLLKQFEDKQLPRASELEWLVSAEDAPQELLPLPGGWFVGSNESCTTPLRGTADWAPPRPQLIFTVHPPPVRKVLLAKQNLRCAGCGSRVAAEYASRFRYCEYLGKYFCTGCHTNQLAVVPARVIHHWDFNRYPVSTFSYRLLEQMCTDPLFRIDDLNPKLYKKVKALERTRAYRTQLHFLKDFLMACRFADHLKEVMTYEPSYSLSEPDRFSLRDLARVRSGELPVDLQAFVKTGLAHVDTCDLCQARGFLCELCHCKDVIFPWTLGEVSRCPRCGACFHRKCFAPPACPRCVRLAARRNTKLS